MFIFISVPKTIECIVIALVFALSLSACSYRLLGILQECGYADARYVGWLRRQDNMARSRFGFTAYVSLLTSAVTASCFSFLPELAAIISLVPFVIFFCVYLYADRRYALRVPVSLTPRMCRLWVLHTLLWAIVLYVFVVVLNAVDALWGNFFFGVFKYCLFSVPVVLAPQFVRLSNLCAKAYEVPHNNKFIRQAQQKMQGASLTVVGITGSYGKTSVKNMLSQMLSAKFRVVATPLSYNTPLGVSKTVNESDLSATDVLVVEMGARNVGDIASLCRLCPPDYAVITGICPQHLQSFGTIENVVKAKGELLQNVKTSAFIAKDCGEYFKDYSCQKQVCDCIKDVVATAQGTQFTLTLGGKDYAVQTGLLGEHNAYNIGLAAQTAYAMGVSAEQICEVIPTLTATEHRLQRIEKNGVTILDDGYNANVIGAQAALSALNLFEGRKIVVTPGLVELGVLEEQENVALGAQLVDYDVVILVGRTLVGAVRRGYVKAGGDEQKLTVVPDLEHAKKLLAQTIRQGDTVLFLNDLPDIY